MNRLDDLYREAILDHRRNPRNHERLSSPDIVGDAINPFCGDEIHLQVDLDAERRVVGVGLQAEGCSINVASGSMLTEAIEGKGLDELDRLIGTFRMMMRGDAEAEALLRREGDLANLVGVRDYPVRIKCALLPLSALANGMQDYEAGAEQQDR